MKRIYTETVKSWATKLGITGGTLIGLIFMYLFAIGAISNVSYSGDMICAGTENDPCYAFINFTANEDIFIYPTNYDPWGRNTLFSFDPNVKSWKLERSWGSGWREIPFNKTCTGTWCGAKDSSGCKYSIAFREGRNYQLRITGYKNSPYDTIKWGAFSGVDEIDPIFYSTEIFKSYDDTNQVVKISDSLEDIADITLDTPHRNLVPMGDEVKFAEITLDSKQIESLNVLSDMKLINLKNNKSIEREIKYKYWTTKQVEFNNSKVMNNSKEENTSTIEYFTDYYEEEYWENFDFKNVKEGVYTIGLFMQINYGDEIEWIPTFYGVEIKEWAIVVQSSGTVTYYDDAGTNYTIQTFTSNGYFNVTGGTLNVEVLVVAGGGSGGTEYGGAGGAGGLLYDSDFDITAGNYIVTVGSGGVIVTTTVSRGNSGANSIFSTMTAIGGGGGGGSGVIPLAGYDGGSGGGGAFYDSGTSLGAAGSGTSGQGYAGGTGQRLATGGGGGAGGVGEAANTDGTNYGGDGGVGVSNSITGSAVYYAGGGGGFGWAVIGTGGNGGGGAGGLITATKAEDGTDGLGGGGGAGGWPAVTEYGGAGGDGVVIIRYLTPETDTCTYSGSGTWAVNFIDNCSITETVNLGGEDLTLHGDVGRFDIRAAILNFGQIIKHGDGEIAIWSGGSINT